MEIYNILINNNQMIFKKLIVVQLNKTINLIINTK